MRYLLLPAFLPTAAMLASGYAYADPRTECQTATCKVLILTPDEEKVLVGQNGILDTAAAARALDLGNIVSYFRTKVATAPAGDPKPAPTPAPESSGQK